MPVGIRDYCKEETDMIAAMPDRIKTYFDLDLKQAEYTGKSKKEIFTPIVEALPQEVYISFDIDGLDPKLCQHTGTPVPGGFEFEEALFLIQMVFESGRKVIGFDINETSDPHFGKEDGDRFDAIVGARLLFRMANMMLHF